MPIESPAKKQHEMKGSTYYALILTDSLHLPTTIGYFNTRPAACQARQSAHAWLKGESQSVEDLKCFSNAAMNILEMKTSQISTRLPIPSAKPWMKAHRLFSDGKEFRNETAIPQNPWRG